MNFDKTHFLEMTIHDSALINSKIHYASKIYDHGKKYYVNMFWKMAQWVNSLYYIALNM